MKRIFLLVSILAVTLSVRAQVISIHDAKVSGAGASVTVSGVVLNGAELGIIRYIQDETGGLAIYDGTKMAGIERGDSITVSGMLVDYNNLLEMQPVANVVVEKKNVDLPVPVLLTPSQLGEAYEGMLIRINNAVFDDSGNAFEAKKNYGFTANGESGEVRISDDASPFVGQVVPSSEVIIVGILSQFYDIYQVLVRGTDDIRSSSRINFLTPPVLKDLSTSGFTIEWDTDSTGTTEMFYGHTDELELGQLTLPGTGKQHSITISGANPSELYYIKPFSVRGEDTAHIFTQVYITQSVSTGEMKAYFNKPVDNSVSMGTDAVYLDHAIDDTLIAYINRAEESIDFTIYNFNNEGISNISAALNNAHNRGVVVRVVYDINQSNFGTDELVGGIGKMASPVSNYPDYGIMHNKFVVFDALSDDPDKAFVWTGATNFTDGQINVDPNNVIIIQDKSLAIAYRLEFNEMFGSEGAQPDPAKSRFGPDKLDNTPHEFFIGGKRVECYFSPSDPTHKNILKTIRSANTDLSIATMLITKTDLGYAIRDVKEAGVLSGVLVNDIESCNEIVVNTLRNSLAENFRVSGEPGIMHHKYMIVDQSDAASDPILLTGCHNWSASAEERNDENTLIIHDQTLANIYYQEFTNRFKYGRMLVDAPGCSPDFVTMNGGSAFRYDVLYNDDIPGPVALEITRQPANGTAVVESDMTITYRPNSGFNKDLDTVFYKVCMESNLNICDSSIMVVYVNLPVSVFEQEYRNGFPIFPNPTGGLLYIPGFARLKPILLTVTDMTGRTVIHESGFNDAGKDYILDLGELTGGIYYLTIETESGNRMVHPVVLQK
ncbi:MAG: T9SS type A sorting domain-containing protein [Bacteroidales bacterium]|nr:T9SS type A sorting domain-containing protein [Bacteroidales bacterium]MBN2699587.1 T9SS type A sorting domain-containing protein [Bacteroidales bacterium]